MQIGKAALAGVQSLLDLGDEIGHVRRARRGAVFHIVHRHDERHILLLLLLAVDGRTRGRGGGAGAEGCGGRALIAGVHIALVVIADIEHLRAALGSAREALEAAVSRGAVARDGDDIDVRSALALVHLAHAGHEGRGVVEQRDVNRSGAAVGEVPAVDARAGHAAGRHGEDAVSARNLHDTAENQLAAAALTRGGAGRHDILGLFQNINVRHVPYLLSRS